MAVTLNDIARVVGVKKATVSRVLNNKPNPVKVSETTRAKIFRAAKELGYHPNAAARALSTRRTGHIGFILSDNVTDGWSNMFYSRMFAGVEQACRERGYGLNVSLYNISNIDTFVFPPKVGQRSVDGLVLTDYVKAAVAHRFREFDIPCVCIGDNTEVTELIPTVATDIVGGLFQTICYAVGLGHRRIAMHTGIRRREREVGRMVMERMEQSPETAGCRLLLTGEILNTEPDYTSGKPLMDLWLGMPPEERPTTIIASDQALQGLLRELRKHGVSCPRDVSLISSCNTSQCEFTDPPLTSLELNQQELGRIAANMLIDHLEQGTSLGPEMSRNDFPCRIIIRESCAKTEGSGEE